MLELRALHVWYPGRELPTLKDVRLKVSPGEVVLLTGPTGSGKSTLLRCVAGVIPQLSAARLEGDVLLDGHPIQRLPPGVLSRRVGLVQQSPDAQLVATRVFDEVAFGLENLRVPPVEIHARVAKALTQVGLETLAQEEVRRLSGGQKQRLVIAAMLAMEPELLLLDEPISQLDPQGAQEVLALLQPLVASRQLAVVLVEHRLEEVAHVVDRVVLMAEGRVVLDDPARVAWMKAEVFQGLGLTVPTIPALCQRLSLEPTGGPEVMIEPVLEALRGRLKAMPMPRADVEHRAPGGDLLQADQLWFAYERGKVEVVRGVSLTLRRGDRVALMGANGAGKSTLLGLLGGVFRATRGAVRWLPGQQEGQGGARMQARAGVLFQEPDLMLLSDTVAEELAFAPYHQGLGRQDAAARAKEGLIALGLEGLADEAPLGLSRGQRLRVAAASVLTAHPRLLLLDEPTTGQDRQHIESLMETFVQHPALEAMLFCTHDVGAALRYANRLLVMQCGSIVADGPPGEVLRDPDVRARGGLRLPVAAQLGTRLGVTALSLEQWLDWLEPGSSP